MDQLPEKVPDLLVRQGIVILVKRLKWGNMQHYKDGIAHSSSNLFP